MKLEQEPRIEAGANFMFSLKDIFRKIAMAANGHDDALFGSAGSLAELSAGLVGLVGMFPVAAAPAGWLKANGATISRTAYAALFARIGTIYGAGDGSTTFRLPDLRGEFPRAWDDGRGVDPTRTIGSAQSDAIRNISGTLGFHGSGTGTVLQSATGAFVPGMLRGAYGGSTIYSGPTSFDSATFNAQSQVPTATENRPRNVALLACIKF